MTHTLLFADHSITYQRVIELTFSGEDIAVVAVGDGDQAVARIPDIRPDIVLADIGMPGRSGYEVAAFVKSRPDLKHIPVLLLAGAFEPVDELRARDVRSDGVLVKPFEPRDLVQRVRELLARGTSHPHHAASSGQAEMASPDPPVPHEDDPTAAVHDGHQAARGPADSSAGPRRQPEAAGGTTGGDEALEDDYFERLDAAVASHRTRATAEGPETADTPDDEPGAVPTLDALLGGVRSAASEAVRHPAPAPGKGGPDAATPRGSGLADMFGALLAVEEGEPGAVPPRMTGTPGLDVSDELVDRVAARVLQRLSPDTARDVVAPILSAAAERLLRQEIAQVQSGRDEGAS